MAAYQYVYTVTAAQGTSPGLWSTNGTATIYPNVPTTLIAPVVVGTATTVGFLPGYSMARLANGLVVFGATSDGSTNPFAFLQGIQLWVTDGTAAGTTQIFTMADSSFGQPGDISAFTGFTTWNNLVLFEYNNGQVNNDTLFATNGTGSTGQNQGTYLLSLSGADDSSIAPGDGASTGAYFVYTTTTVAASAGLWSANGAPGGAALIAPAVTGTSSVIGFLPTYQMASLPNGKVIFGATDNGSTSPLAIVSGIQLWVTDGTAAKTTKIFSLPDTNAGNAGDTAGLSGFTTVGTKVLFVYNDGSGGLTLYSTDGTTGGTQNTGASVAANSLGVGQAASTGTKLIYATAAGVYASDGTAAGTILLKATSAGTFATAGFLAGTQMATLPNGQVVFAATANGPLGIGALTAGVQLWVTDGTVANTQQIYAYPDPSAGQPGDTVSFFNFVSVGNGVQFEYNTGSPNQDILYLTDGTAAGTISISNQYVDNTSVGVGLGASPICFLPGTRIATPDGEVQIQDLTVGDLVRVVSGEARPVRWIGHGKVMATRGHRSPATPVIVCKGAFADNVPNADLRVTKAHSFLIDNVLIPIEYLINHRSILWDDWTQEVELYHVELDTHDVIFANGAPAETYRDDGNRWLFQNANDGWHLPPQPPCVPVTTRGPVVDNTWHRLCRRAGPRKLLPMTDDPDLHLMVNGRRVDAVSAAGRTQVFRLPAWPVQVQIGSRSAVPAEMGIARDQRSLGVALRRLAIRQGTAFAVLDARDDRLQEGFHAFEPHDALRWTDGLATVPTNAFPAFEGTAEIVLTVAGTSRYVDDGAAPGA